MPFDIAVCGGGIGGLACALALARKGNTVTVYERSQQPPEHGASITVGSNAARVLKEWDVYDSLADKYGACPLESIQFKRYDNGKTLWEMQFQGLSQVLGASLRRSDYWKCLYDGALKNGVKVLFGQQVVDVDQADPSLTLANGETIKYDFIIAADGIRSHLRPKIMEPARLTRHGVAWTWFVESEKIKNDPATAWILGTPSGVIFWYGPNSICFIFPARNRNQYNIAFKAPEDNAELNSAKFGDLISLKKLQSSTGIFDKTVQKLAEMADEAFAWPISSIDSCDRYYSESRKVVALGDTAHAIHPAIGQGSSMAIEDAHALGECLETAKSVSDIPKLVEKWSDLRTERMKHVARISLASFDSNILPDGPEQEARDARLAAQMAMMQRAARGPPPPVKPSPHGDAGTPEVRAYVNSYDIHKEVHDMLRSLNV